MLLSWIELEMILLLSAEMSYKTLAPDPMSSSISYMCANFEDETYYRISRISPYRDDEKPTSALYDVSRWSGPVIRDHARISVNEGRDNY